MTEQEKQLLLVNLCSMLPYGVVVKAIYKDGDGWKTNDRKLLGIYQHDGQVYLDGVYTDIDKVKPYLRPLSSMTNEEKETYQMFFNEDGLLNTSIDIYLDWLLEGHFDFRGLIPMGLALEAPEGMYNT